MILAGDIGGTKTLLGLFARDRTDKLPLHQKSFPSQQYDRLETIVAEFLQGFLAGLPAERSAGETGSNAGSTLCSLLCGGRTRARWQSSNYQPAMGD